MASDSSQEERVKSMCKINESQSCESISALCIERNSLAEKIQPHLFSKPKKTEDNERCRPEGIIDVDSLQNDVLTRSQLINTVASNALSNEEIQEILKPVELPTQSTISLPEEHFHNVCCQVKSKSTIDVGLGHRERKRWMRPNLKAQASQCDLFFVTENRKNSDMSNPNKPEHNEYKTNQIDICPEHYIVSNVGSDLCQDSRELASGLVPYVLQSSKDNIISSGKEDAAVSARVPSPTSGSSITSVRPLEWDSGADVGYLHHDRILMAAQLSTIERIALVQGHSAVLKAKTDDLREHSKDTENMCPTNRRYMNTPLAESTHHENCASSTSDIESEEEISPILRERSSESLAQKIMNENFVKNIISEGQNFANKSTNSKDSTKFENAVAIRDKFHLKNSKTTKCYSDTYKNKPGSIDKSLKFLHKFDPCSASSSSVTTVVQNKNSKPVTVDKATNKQFHCNNKLPCDIHSNKRKESNAEHSDTDLQSGITREKSEPEQRSIRNENVSTVPILHQEQSNPREQNRQLIKQIFNTLDSVTSSTQTNESFFTSQNTGGTYDGRRESTGVVGSAHSFEYLPGHMYENVPEKTPQSTEESSTEYPVVYVASHNKSDSDANCSSTISSTFAKDVDECVLALKSLVEKVPCGSGKRKHLLNIIKNKLVNSTYSSDKNISQYLQTSRIETCKQLEKPENKQNIYVNKNPEKSDATKSSGLSSPLFIPCSSGKEKLLQSNGVIADLDTKSSSSIDLEIRRRVTRVDTDKQWAARTVTCSQQMLHHRVAGVPTANVRESALLSFYERERATQLSWIKTEISHLNNLKQLLERQSSTTQQLPRTSYSIMKLSRSNVQSSRSVTPNTGTAESERNEIRNYVPHEAQSQLQDHTDVRNTPRKFSNNVDKSISSEISEKEPSVPHSAADQTIDWNSHKITKSQKIGDDKPEDEAPVTCHQQHSVAIQSDVPSYHSKEIQTSLRLEFADLHVSAEQDKVYESDFTNRQKNRPEDTGTNKKSEISVQTPAVNSNPSDTLEGVSEGILDSCRHVAKETVDKLHDGGDNSKYKDIENNTPMCCCECREVLRELLSKNDSIGKDPQRKVKSKVESTSVELCEHCHKPTPRKLASESKNGTKKNTESLLVSNPAVSSEPLENSSYKLRRKDVATETVDNIGVQTTSSVGLLPVVPPKWFAKQILEENRKKKDKSKKIKTHSRRCPCCNGIENDPINLHDSSNSVSKQYVEPSSVITDNANRPDRNDKQIFSKETQATAPVGYILTLEESDSAIIEHRSESKRKSLQEIKVKVPPSRIIKNLNGSSTSSSLSSNLPDYNNQNNNDTDKHVISEQRIPCPRKLTLQEYLQMNRPDFVASAENRRFIIDELAYLRELKHEARQRLLAAASCASSFIRQEEKTAPTSQPQKKRVFSQRSMRKLTEKKYGHLPEVQMKKAEKKRKEDYRTNRLMAEVFTRKLQKKTLKGEVNLSNSVSVISSL